MKKKKHILCGLVSEPLCVMDDVAMNHRIWAVGCCKIHRSCHISN